MTEPYVPSPEDLLREEAIAIIATPPEPLADAVDLPDEVRNGRIEDEGETHPSVDHEPLINDGV